MSLNISKFITDLIGACGEARKAIENEPDVGTCNFDAVFVPVGKGQQLGRKSGKFEDALSAAGFTCFFHDGRIRRGYILGIGLGGQGYTRTKAAEVVNQTLQSKGHNTSMWYQVD